MNPEINNARLDSEGWIFFVKFSFFCAACAVGFGIWMMPADYWVRGYLMMGVLFLTGTSFTLAKTMRDQFEAGKMINQLAQARTEKLLKEYGAQ